MTVGCREGSHWQMQFLVDDPPRTSLGSLLAESFGPQATLNFITQVSYFKHINNVIKIYFLRIYCDVVVNMSANAGLILFFFSVVLWPKASHGLPIPEDLRSHKTTHYIQ